MTMVNPPGRYIVKLLVTVALGFGFLQSTAQAAPAAMDCRLAALPETSRTTVAPSTSAPLEIKKLQVKWEENYEKRNAVLADRYKDLAFLYADPDALYQTMKSRFEEQKKITPDDPRLFDFHEAAPTIKAVSTELESYIKTLKTDLAQSQDSVVNKMKQKVLGKDSEKTQTLEKVLQYATQLKSEIDNMISTDRYAYRDVVYNMYFYSRIRGFYQFKELGVYHQVTKYIDMLMHGYRRLNIDQELNLYAAKDSPVFQVRSMRYSQEFRLAELPFRDAFENKETLDYVIVPSIYPMGASAFMHLLPHRIHVLGATTEPVAADGFKRPGGLFWMHDTRHEGDRYLKLRSYFRAQNLTAKQEHLLMIAMHQWQTDFLALKKSITDPELAAAVDHYHFYRHHDVGLPMIPSIFLQHYKTGMDVFYAFLYHKRWAAEKIPFKNWKDNTTKAQQILSKFWSERLDQEKAILQKDPVIMKSWDDWFPSYSEKKQLSTTGLLSKAIESKEAVRLTTESGGIDGTLSQVIYDADSNPIYVRFAGAAQLVDTDQRVIKGQDAKVHADGYSTPIGRITKITANGRNSSMANIKPDEQVEIQYESGILVQGTLGKVSVDGDDQVNVLTFKSADVTLNGRSLYKAQWGQFDLMVADGVQSVEFIR